MHTHRVRNTNGAERIRKVGLVPVLQQGGRHTHTHGVRNTNVIERDRKVGLGWNGGHRCGPGNERAASSMCWRIGPSGTLSHAVISCHKLSHAVTNQQLCSTAVTGGDKLCHAELSGARGWRAGYTASA